VSSSRKANWPFRIVLIGSVVFHALLGLGAVYAPKKEHSEQIAIAVLEKAKKAEPEPEDEPPPPPPPPPPKRPETVAPQRAEAPAEEAPPEPDSKPPPKGLGDAFDGFADLGAIGTGGPGGMAVRAAPREARPAPVKRQEEQPRQRTLTTGRQDACEEALVKPKPTHMVGAQYPDEARKHELEGVVRVKITLNAQGEVIAAEVAKGIGSGLDEAALAAARKWTFQPATKCGKPVETTITIGMRFSLGG
jgi:periplasmic protein TonB